eukprot:928486-Rhodomonas_salina.2
MLTRRCALVTGLLYLSLHSAGGFSLCGSKLSGWGGIAASNTCLRGVKFGRSARTLVMTGVTGSEGGGGGGGGGATAIAATQLFAKGLAKHMSRYPELSSSSSATIARIAHASMPENLIARSSLASSAERERELSMKCPHQCPAVEPLWQLTWCSCGSLYSCPPGEEDWSPYSASVTFKDPLEQHDGLESYKAAFARLKDSPFSSKPTYEVLIATGTENS